MKTEEIFGMVDDALDSMERHHPKLQPVKAKKRRALPKLNVNRRETPPELDLVEAGNVVYVPEQELRRLASKIEFETDKLNKLLLGKMMPLLLSYQTSTKYVSAALKEGLDVEIDFDPGLLDCIRHVGYLSVVTHFIRNSQLPVSVKKRFIRHFSDKLAEQAVITMTEENKAQTKRTAMQELQAVIYSRNKNKAELKTPEHAEPDVKKAPPRTGVKRSRR